MFDYNSKSKLTSAVLGNNDFSYDADGNAILIKTATGTWSVSYNAENRPVRFECAGTQTVVECGYDSLGRRFEKKVTVAGTLVSHERYAYRGFLQIAAFDVAGTQEPTLKRVIYWDPTEETATRPLAISIVGDNVYFPTVDLTKNVCELVDFYGNVAATYDYAPFGNVSAGTPSGSAVPANPLQWSSEIYDSELDLVYYNYRHYSPALGRFLARDPIEEQGGLNLYAFVGNCTGGITEILGLDRYVFDGEQICRISDDGKVCHTCWQAVSGRPDKNGKFYYSPERQKMKSKGPIPEGKYRLPGRRTTNPSNTGRGYWHNEDWEKHSGWIHAVRIRLGLSSCSHVRLENRYSGLWGRRWGRLVPEKETEVYGRCDFNIHGGTHPGSAGCIDVGCNEVDFFDDVKRQDEDFVPVDVDYSKRLTKVCGECKNRKGEAWSK